MTDHREFIGFDKEGTPSSRPLLPRDVLRRASKKLSIFISKHDLTFFSQYLARCLKLKWVNHEKEYPWINQELVFG